MLQIGIHTHDALPDAVIQPRKHRRLMAKVAGKVDHTYPRIRCRQFCQNLPRGVRTSVVDKNQFVIPRQRLKNRSCLPIELMQRLFLVVNRNHDRDRLWFLSVHIFHPVLHGRLSGFIFLLIFHAVCPFFLIFLTHISSFN